MFPKVNKIDINLAIKNVFNEHAKSLSVMSNHVKKDNYEQAIKTIKNSNGHVIVCGMGKSGHVGKKIAATFASTGTPSFFLHPSEAYHGDLGMITKEDVIILISNSGETDEVLQLIPSLKLFRNKIIAITNKVDSTLAINAEVVLPIIMDKEACPNNLAPTTSTIITMAIGDALAIALMQHKQFMANDFARYHPGGALGKKLLTKVSQVMVNENLPIISRNTKFSDFIIIMNETRLGVALVVENKKVVGVITDGDLRRCLNNKHDDIQQITAEQIMTKSPKRINQNEMLNKAEQKMTENKISSLVVQNNEDELVGLIQIYNV
ncbi:KpsF/GutQ family sugar-phosphate isomerase [Thalassotalea piscium]